MKRYFSLIYLGLVPFLSMFATERIVEIDFNNVGCDNKGYMLPYNVDGVEIIPEKGSRTLGPQYYSNYSGMVFYGTNYMKLAVTDAAIEKIEMTCSSVLPIDEDKVCADKGMIKVSDEVITTWTNNVPVDNLILTPRAHTLDLGACICSMKLYLTDKTDYTQRVATPEVTPYGGQIFDDTDIVITTSTPDAVIYYTVDGTLPQPGKSSTQKYDGPIHLDKSTVVSAIAVKDNQPDSYVGAHGFSIPIEVNNISELLSTAKQRIYYTIKCDLRVTCCLGSTCWITDGTDAISLFGDAVTNMRPSNGSHLLEVTGRFNLNNENPELEYINQTRFIPVKGERILPREIKAAEITEADVNHFLIIRNAELQSLGNYDYSLTDESGTIIIRNNYRIGIDESLFDRKLDVELLPAIYYDTMRYYIASVTDPNAPIKGDDPEPQKPNDGRTPETAYTIAEAIACDAQFSKEWIRGYIVGSYPAMASMYEEPTFGSEGASDHSIVLADTPDCNDPSKCIRVINMQDAVRIDLNLKDNPQQLGQYIAIFGPLYSELLSMQVPTDFCYQNPPTKLDIITGDSGQSTTEYYTLTGVRIDSRQLQSGTMYIRRNGKQVEKFIMR